LGRDRESFCQLDARRHGVLNTPAPPRQGATPTSLCRYSDQQTVATAVPILSWATVPPAFITDIADLTAVSKGLQQRDPFVTMFWTRTVQEDPTAKADDVPKPSSAA
jgi:hypothetical protein